MYDFHLASRMRHLFQSNKDMLSSSDAVHRGVRPTDACRAWSVRQFDDAYTIHQFGEQEM